MQSNNPSMMNIQVSRLPNGVRVATAAMPGVESVSLGIWAGVGSRHEPRRLAGASHFIEHLVFKGSVRRSARQISQAIEGRGGYLNAFTQEEHTCFYARVTYDRMVPALDVLADMVLHPRFDPADIEKERGVIVEEIMMYRDQPQHVVHDMLGEALWADHPAGRPVIGRERAIGAMRRDDIAAYTERHYAAGALGFTFAGRVDHETCRQQVADVTGALPKRGRRSCPPVTARTAQRDTHVARKAIEQSHLAMGFRLFGYPDERRYALKLLNVILGENMSSRLFQVVREQRGLAYSIHSSMHLMRDTGALVVGAGLDRRRTLKALDLIMREVRRLREQPAGPREFARARDYVLGQMRISLESTNSQMLWLGNSLMTRERMITPEEAIAGIRAVTPDAVRDLAAAYLTADRASVCLLSPDTPPEAGDDVRAIMAAY